MAPSFKFLDAPESTDSSGPPHPASLETRMLDALCVAQSPVLAPISSRPYLGSRPGSIAKHLAGWGLRHRECPRKRPEGQGLYSEVPPWASATDRTLRGGKFRGRSVSLRTLVPAKVPLGQLVCMRVECCACGRVWFCARACVWCVECGCVWCVVCRCVWCVMHVCVVLCGCVCGCVWCVVCGVLCCACVCVWSFCVNVCCMLCMVWCAVCGCVVCCVCCAVRVDVCGVWCVVHGVLCVVC